MGKVAVLDRFHEQLVEHVLLLRVQSGWHLERPL